MAIAHEHGDNIPLSAITRKEESSGELASVLEDRS